MTRAAFVERFGGVFEHSPWIAERAWDGGLARGAVSAGSVHAALCRVFREATAEEQMTVVRAHPDLAGRLALAGALTQASTAEQSSAGLDRCTPEELARFNALNDAYKEKFGFPFIMAVRGASRAAILAAFERRLDNDPQAEFAEALSQIERIALLRLKEMLP